MEAYLAAPFSGNEWAVVSKVCRKLLNKIIRPSLAVPYVVALGKRNLLWDLLPDHIEEHVLEVNHEKGFGLSQMEIPDIITEKRGGYLALPRAET